MTPVLRVSDLSVDYRTNGVWSPALTSITFEVNRGEILGIVGESGCGKSTLARAVSRLLPDNGRIAAGAVELNGEDLVTMRPQRLAQVRWSKVAVIFQSAFNVLDPVYKIGFQIAEGIRKHEPDTSRKAALERSKDLLASVGIAKNRIDSYPHELSGGMRQRVSIAMAMSLSPDIVIADEPTTALDVVSQDSVLDRLVSLQRKTGTSLIVISHDMGIIAETCDRVAVMYAGQIVELGAVNELFAHPSHPYAMGLRNAIPGLGGENAVAIPGFPPPSSDWPKGCRFAPRCPFRVEICSEPPPWLTLNASHHALCHRANEAESLRPSAADPSLWAGVKDLNSHSLRNKEGSDA